MSMAFVLFAAVALKAPFGSFEIAETEFQARDFAITDFGAKSDGTKCTEALAAAMEACERAGGGRVAGGIPTDNPRVPQTVQRLRGDSVLPDNLSLLFLHFLSDRGLCRKDGGLSFGA